MRSFNPREKADIIVSELLGSFGDNELSPECLDGVMRTLKRASGEKAPSLRNSVDCLPFAADGISIPASYTSYLAPISTSRLHTEVTNPQVASASTVMDAKPAEQPYVVMFSQFHTLSATGGRLGVEKVQECWTFDHPRPDIVTDEQGAFSRRSFAWHAYLIARHRPSLHEPPQRALRPPLVPHPSRRRLPRLCGLLRGRSLR